MQVVAYEPQPDARGRQGATEPKRMSPDALPNVATISMQSTEQDCPAALTKGIY
jgi:hypothetical protein